MYSNEELRLQRALKAAEFAHAAQREQLAKHAQELRRLQKQKQSAEKHPDWHKYRLGAEMHAAGFNGQMSPACAYLNSLSLDEYCDAIAPFGLRERDTVTELELRAITSNLQDWTAKGGKIILERETKRYWDDHSAFGIWQAEHPRNKQWRSLTPTSRQMFLADRTAEFLEIDPPVRPSRGEAHEWLDAHGANLRIRSPRPTRTHQQGHFDPSSSFFEEGQ